MSTLAALAATLRARRAERAAALAARTPAEVRRAHAAPSGQMRADCYYRAWNKDKARTFSPRNVRVVTVIVAVEATIQQILAAALAAGASKGTGATGIFEVQTDRGIYSTTDGRPIVTTTPRKAAKVTYATWDELDAAERRHAPADRQVPSTLHLL